MTELMEILLKALICMISLGMLVCFLFSVAVAYVG